MPTINFTTARIRRIKEEIENVRTGKKSKGLALAAACYEGGFKNLFRSSSAIKKKLDNICRYFEAGVKIGEKINSNSSSFFSEFPSDRQVEKYNNWLRDWEINGSLIDDNYLINQVDDKLFESKVTKNYRILVGLLREYSGARRFVLFASTRSCYNRLWTWRTYGAEIAEVLESHLNPWVPKRGEDGTEAALLREIYKKIGEKILNPKGDLYAILKVAEHNCRDLPGNLRLNGFTIPKVS